MSFYGPALAAAPSEPQGLCSFCSQTLTEHLLHVCNWEPPKSLPGGRCGLQVRWDDGRVPEERAQGGPGRGEDDEGWKARASRTPGRWLIAQDAGHGRKPTFVGRQTAREVKVREAFLQARPCSRHCRCTVDTPPF